MQKCANLVELEKCCKMTIWLQKSALIQPRTSLGKSEIRRGGEASVHCGGEQAVAPASCSVFGAAGRSSPGIGVGQHAPLGDKLPAERHFSVESTPTGGVSNEPCMHFDRIVNVAAITLSYFHKV